MIQLSSVSPESALKPMANVVTIAELRELKQLKATLPAAVAAAQDVSGDQLDGVTQFERRMARDRLKWMLARIQEIENKSGSSNPMRRL
jgi:hypothetical protein